MQALKALVIFLGVLIVAGLTLVAYGLFARYSGPAEEPRDAGPALAFGEVTLDLPAACRLAEARLEDGQLVLRAAGPAEAGCRLVVILDAATGRELGRVRLAPAP